MSGRRIDDHSAWMGGKKAGVPLPMESKMKEMKSASGQAETGREFYPDTQEDIERVQEEGISKSKSHKMKPGYRY